MAYQGVTQTNIDNANHGARVAGQSIYEIKEKPVCTVGTRLVLGDRVFRYAKAGGTLGCGYLCQQEVPEATYTSGQALAEHSAGNKVVEWTVNTSGTTFTKDQYAGGYFLVDDAGGTATEEAYMYKIKSNTLATVTNVSYLTLYDALAKDISGSATGAIMRNPYMDVVIDATTACILGVPPVEVTDNYYFWLQTWGPCGMINDGTGITIAHLFTSTAGEIDVRDANTENVAGYAMMTGGANDASIVMLRVSP